jgi:PEP-CTERM motif
MTTNKKLSALAVLAVLATPIAGFAAPVTFGALSSDDSGSTQIIHDSLNNYDWMRWDTLTTLNYEQTLAATSAGGQFEGWQFAYANEAQLFTNALLQGLTNDCAATGDATCNMLLPTNLADLLGDTPGALTETVNFLSNGGPDDPAGFMQYTHEGSFASLYKTNSGASLENTGWLLYRTDGGTETPPSAVPEPGTFALFGAAFAAIGFMRRRLAA